MTRVKTLTTSAEEKNFTTHNRKVAIFFGSETCPACRSLKPIFNKLSTSNTYNNISFGMVEISKTKTANIQRIPVVVFYNNGMPIGQIEGSDERGLIEKLNNLVSSK